MGQIDLKYADLYVQDGTVHAGAVNNSSGYTSGVNTMLIDGVVGILPVGIPFTITGETGDVIHTITAHTETSGNTTSITFTPGTAGAITDNDVISFGPNRLTLHIGEGNLEWTEKRNIEYVKDRGKLAYTRLGDEEPVDASMEFIWDFLTSDATGGEPPTMKEALTQKGQCSNWVSSADDKCQPYAVDVVIDYIPPCGGVKKERIVIKDFRHEELDHSTKDAKVSVKGKANITEVVSTRI